MMMLEGQAGLACSRSRAGPHWTYSLGKDREAGDERQHDEGGNQHHEHHLPLILASNGVRQLVGGVYTKGMKGGGDDEVHAGQTNCC